MDPSWSTPPSSSAFSEHQHREIDPSSSSSSSNFDPIKEWLIDLEHLDPSMTSDSDFLNQSDPGNIELRGHQDSTLVEAFIDHKMEKVSLADANMDITDAGCNKTEVVDAAVTVSNGIFVGEEKNDAIHEVCAVNDPIIAANESDQVESSDELEGSEDSSSRVLSTSSSSSSSLSSDEEEESSSSEEEEDDNEMEKGELAVEVEEGEIDADELEEAIFGSDGEEAVPKGPIKSKHEIEDLPPVPPLEVSLEVHHETSPVGIVSSILGNRVIVEGSKQHSPLSEGSILWITETRMPLGRIDEIFGPVINPYYIVRYNSDSEVPQGINIGADISFVADFANHILTEKYRNEKWYDASGADDEEVSEVEFSDDEKEAEYKRSLRQKKRDPKHAENQESGFCNKNSNFKGSRFRKDNQLQSPHSRSSQPGHLHAPQAPVNIGRNNFNPARGAPKSGTNNAPLSTMVHAFPSQQLNTLPGRGIQPQPSPLSIQGGFPLQPQSVGIQSGFSPQPQIMAMQGGLPPSWMPNQHQNQSLNNFVNGIMQYQQQQLVPNVGALPWFGGASNPSADLTFALLGLMAQRRFAQAPLGPGNVNHSAHEQMSLARNQGAPGQTECYNINLQGPWAMNNRGQALPVVNQGGFGQVPSWCGSGSPQGSLAASTNDQSHGQASLASQMPSGSGNASPNGQASGVNGQSGTTCPNVQFKQGRSSYSSRGKKPYGRGGRHSFGRRGGR